MRIEDKLKAAGAKLHDDANQLEQETAAKVAELRAKADAALNATVPAAILNLPEEAHAELEKFFQVVHGVL